MRRVAMRKAILMLLLAVVSNSAVADWVKVGIINDEETFYCNPTSILRDGDRVKMSCLHDYNEAQIRPYEGMQDLPFLSTLDQREYDCKTEQFIILNHSYYSGNMGSGDVVYSYNDPGEWIPIVHEGTGDKQLKIACKRWYEFWK